MKKAILEFAIFASILLIVWFAISRVDWMTVFKVEQVSRNTEKKIGDLFVDMLKKSDIEISTPSVKLPIDSLLSRICESNNIDRSKIKIHIFQKDEANAFALPNNHIVVYTSLIKACKNESELCGVMCHELAHLQKKHVMNKLVKDIGLSVVISMAGGKGNGEIVKKAIHQLSSTAYDRKLETEADLTAVDYMIRADIDPEPFADFLVRLTDDENLPSQLYWISTHPQSKERSEQIKHRIKGQNTVKVPILKASTWELLKKKVQE